MRIGIVSDTHMPSRARKLPEVLVQGLQGVELILHAGDWMTPDTVAMFEQIAPTDGVAGNNDGYDIIQRFGLLKIIEAAGKRIGIIHGHGTYQPAQERAWTAFKEAGVDAIVFGHSHIPYMEHRNGVLLFNPGSPTDKRRQPRYSYGMMEITETGIEARHVYFDAKE